MSSVITVLPAQQCAHPGCSRLTAYGIVEDDSVGYIHAIMYCWQHGYYDVLNNETDPKQLELQQESIERFVIGAHSNKGVAHILGPVPIRKVEEYEDYDWEENTPPIWYITPKAWIVEYINPTGRKSEVYVVWDYVDLSFYLFLLSDQRQHLGETA